MSDQTPTPTPQAGQAPTPDPATTPAPAPVPQSGEQAVPYARFKQVNDQLADLKGQISKLTGEKEQQSTTAKTLEDRLAALEGDLTKERSEKQRLKVASEKKLPPELADRLVGTTPEELAADADRLLAFLKPAGGPGVPPPSGGGKPARLDLSSMTPAEIRKAADEGKI